ncbi:MAG: hypothetical protein NUV57_00485 [archaeon]|nr:hypothetical protein [archaeon]
MKGLLALKTSKGQAVIIDFAIAFLLFALAWAFITVEFEEKYAERIDADSLKLMKLKAETTIDFLVKSKGSPENWEELTINDLNSVGLAETDRALSESKLSAFQNFSSSYDTLRATMGLEQYDFYFQFTGVDDANAGLVPGSNANQIIVQRIVEYKGEVGVAELNVYKLD